MATSAAFLRLRHTLRRLGRDPRRDAPRPTLPPAQRSAATASGPPVTSATPGVSISGLGCQVGAHTRLNRHTMARAAMLMMMVMTKSTTPMPTSPRMPSPVASAKVFAITAAMV